MLFFQIRAQLEGEPPLYGLVRGGAGARARGEQDETLGHSERPKS